MIFHEGANEYPKILSYIANTTEIELTSFIKMNIQQIRYDQTALPSLDLCLKRSENRNLRGEPFLFQEPAARPYLLSATGSISRSARLDAARLERVPRSDDVGRGRGQLPSA